MDVKEKSLKLHEDLRGKIEVVSKKEVKTSEDLSLLYTPGVAEPCVKIHENEDNVYKYTAKKNLVGVVSDGSAVLGLGNIGAKASIPVMEGKAILFKEFGDVDAFPICIDSTDVEDIVKTVKLISPVFGGINLEDISAPRCVEVEERLKEELDIPVFHDDQHGTAIVVGAGIINSLKIVNKDIDKIKIVVNGDGSAGYAITKMLINLGAENVIVCGINGVVKEDENNNYVQRELSKITNPNKEDGTLKDVIKNADVFIGVSKGNLVDKEMVESMNDDAVIFAMANPTPEIMPDVAKSGGARVVGTGRSDFENQVNNVLAFPGIFRGALDAYATKISEGMKVAATHAIADFVKEEDLNEHNILPSSLDKEVASAVAKAVYDEAVKENIVKNIK
ncbi:NAD(P)-dependent malic enzyme [Anaerofustis stercorihominis]|uniref:NAD(P)-dependent malic enzyme n=1 Tax=Anaerofustis stercorihominis TaxID=214853 RepID=UPI00214C12A5|nr:malic enzyme-like NAD(P)-binding protein [Anaerofustis stercorihominis]MCR2033638.1 NAD-dependent malic enzyme [Anaerofustis stercorihominis]